MSGRSTPRRLLLLLLVVLTALTTFVGAGVAGAQEDEETGEPEVAEAAENVSGRLDYDDDEGNDVPVPGVEITVATADGEEVAVVETDDDGRFSVPLPGPGEYSFSLNLETIPDGVSIRDVERANTSFSMSPGQDRTLLFPLVAGEGGGRTTGSGTLSRLPQLTFEGLKFGLIIAMSAVGLSLIFGTTGLVNFAHGELVTLGALVAYFFNVTMDIHLLVAAPIAVVVTGLLSGGIDRGFWRPLRSRGTSLIAMLVVSIGVSLTVRYLFLYQFGGRTRPFNQYAIQTDTLQYFGVTMVRKDLWTIVVCVLLLVLVALALERTRIGKATRAVADNRDLAESSGIDVDRVILVVWVAGGALAGVGGVFLGLTEQVNWQGGFQLLLLMFAGVILGGLGTAYGALVGSLVIGITVQVSTLFIANELKNVAALMALVLILLVRPQGILGRKERVG